VLAGPPVNDVRSHLSFLRRPALFLHFFDTHFLQEKGVAGFIDQATREARLATRFAVMLADEVIIPAASLIESKLCAEVLSEFPADIFGTQIVLTGGGSNLDEFVEDKRIQYHAGQPQGRAYRARFTEVLFPWRPRRRSATSDIAADWRDDLSSGRCTELFRTLQGHLPADHERLWKELPERLGRSAFIVENILPHLFGVEKEVPLTVQNRLHAVVNRSYFGSYATDIGAAVFRNMAWLESPTPVPSGDPGNDVDFKRLERACRQERVLNAVSTAKPYKLLELRDDPRFVAAVVNSQTGAMAGVLSRRSGEGVGGMAPGWGPARAKPAAIDFAPQVLLVTALPHEAAAVMATFDTPATVVGHADDPVIYRRGGYFLSDGTTERTVLLATLPAMGTNNAASVATHALRSFPTIQHIVMVGIAGGCPNPHKPEEHVRLGDVVVSDNKGIFDYGHVKQTVDGQEYRSWPQAPSAAMLGAFRNLVAGELLGNRPWEGHLERALAREGLSPRFARPADDEDVLHASEGTNEDILAHPFDPHRRPSLPRVYGGAVATADILLKDPKRRDELRDKFGARAAEMEGSGIQTAGWISGKDILVIRGICDYCDRFKKDVWQHYAALAAAAVTRALIETLPGEWFA
jgi:nucleoside phosphorylase